MVNAVTDPLPNVGNRLSDAILRAEIEVDCDGAVGRFRGSIAIKPHDGVASCTPAYHRGTDEAARSCHEDNFAVVAPWLVLFDSLGHQILYDRATRGQPYRPLDLPPEGKDRTRSLCVRPVGAYSPDLH